MDVAEAIEPILETKIVSAVFYSSEKENDDVKIFSKNLCMHIAASKPEAMDIDKLPPELIESEKKIQEEMIKDSENIIFVEEGISGGSVGDYFISWIAQNVLLLV